jgi:hypothetical protein
MKKLMAFCWAAFVVMDVSGAFGAATVLTPKKANSVAKREEATSVTSLGGSLLPTAMGLVGNVMQLTQQQKALAAECEPTDKEVTFVNNLVKEWAIAGAANPLETGGFGGVLKCDGIQYSDTVRESIALSDSSLICYDTFSEKDAHGAVWAGFPKAAVVTYCSDDPQSSSCSASKKKKVTNLYDIFEKINFDEKDYTKGEASQAAALLQKAANCSGSKLAAKRLESFGGFITGTIGNMGQKTNTGSVMEAVSGMVGSSGLGGLGNLAGIATQFLDR